MWCDFDLDSETFNSGINRQSKEVSSACKRECEHVILDIGKVQLTKMKVGAPISSSQVGQVRSYRLIEEQTETQKNYLKVQIQEL